jgi:NAD-dependent DNA ligase
MKREEFPGQIAQIEEYIRHANVCYRRGDPLMTDAEYDGLMDLLKKIDPENVLLQKAVIEETPTSRKESLPIPMYSLDKCKSVAEIKQWLASKGLSADVELCITGKYDSISLCVNEVTKSAWTRGDGLVGQRSNEHFEKMTLPQEYNVYPDIMSIPNGHTFGEAIIPKRIFEERKHTFLKSDGTEYAVARNMVAGLFNADEISNYLDSVVYVRYGWVNNLNLAHHVELNYLNEVNLIPVPYHIIKANQLTEEMCDELYNGFLQEFEIDGLVIDVNDPYLRSALGRELNQNPAYARALKLPKWSKTLITTAQGIEWSVNKNGTLKPVILIEEVDYNGTKINRVTGHNWRYLVENHIAKNSIIEITRSGEVIPKHLNTISWDLDENQSLITLGLIGKCPICDHNLLLKETGVDIYCSNEECEERIIHKIIHFFRVLDFENFGEGEIRNVFEAGFNSIEKIWNISLNQLLTIDGWADKSAKTFLSQIVKWNNGIGFAKYSYALDLYNDALGEKTIQLIFDHLTELEINNLQLWSEGSWVIDRLCQIPGVAEKTAQIFINGISLYFSNNCFEDIIPIVIWKITPKNTNINGKFKGFKVCFTGFRSKEMEEWIIKEGGEVVSGVSKNTTHLIVNDLNATSSKLKKARNLQGLQIMTDQTFREKCW